MRAGCFLLKENDLQVLFCFHSELVNKNGFKAEILKRRGGFILSLGPERLWKRVT